MPDSTTTDDQLMQAYNDGRSAHGAGEPDTLCPYVERVLQHAWKAGWLKGEMEAINNA